MKVSYAVFCRAYIKSFANKNQFYFRFVFLHFEESESAIEMNTAWAESADIQLNSWV